MNAESLIAKYGEKVQIVSDFKESEVGPRFDPITGEVLEKPDALIVEYDAMAYLKMYNEREVDGTNILSTDAVMIIAAQEVIPEKGWRVKFISEDNSSWFEHFFQESGLDSARIESVRHIRKKGDAVIHLCQLRAG